MTANGTVLFVDDEQDNRTLFELGFRGQFDVRVAASGADALKQMEAEPAAVLLSDERMPGMSGIDLLATVHEKWPDTTRVIVSAYADADRLLRAINLGHAQEYVTKPWDHDDLSKTIERGIATHERKQQLRMAAGRADLFARDLNGHAATVENISPSLQSVYASAERAAAAEAPVLIVGEAGVGKAHLARFIHEHSPRRQGPFVRMPCAHLTSGADWVEAFGARGGRAGRVQLAHGGTLFLDEVDALSLDVQSALLRLLDEDTFVRSEHEMPMRVSVRIVASTTRDLAALSAEQFKPELFHRLNVLPLQVQPLRERPDDVDALMQAFLQGERGAHAPALADGVVHALQAYTWPGNVRELKNVVERALIMSTTEQLELDDFCLQLNAPEKEMPRDEARRREIEQLRNVLVSHGGNCARAARELNIPRTTLVSRAKKHGLL